MLLQLRERIVHFHAVRTSRQPLQAQRQAQADLLLRVVEDAATDPPAVERRLLEGCRRLLNGEKGKVREARARLERLRAEVEALKRPKPPPVVVPAVVEGVEEEGNDLRGEETDTESEGEEGGLEEEKRTAGKAREAVASSSMEMEGMWGRPPSSVELTQGQCDLSLPVTSAPSFASVTSAATRYVEMGAAAADAVIWTRATLCVTAH